MEPKIVTGNNSTYTCLTCKILFNNIDAQREHYKQDWHKYNAKRKVAGLPSVTNDEFNENIKKQIEDNKPTNQVNARNCEICKKEFNAENTYKNHKNSKKHMENVANHKKNKKMNTTHSDNEFSDENSHSKEPKINWKKRFEEAKTEEEFNKVLEEKIKASRKLEEAECLFCDYKGNNFENKMEHMAIEHTFFIPDVEYLVNLKGLISYLNEKISLGNTCIYCEKMFHDLEGVRKHMLDKGHTKIRYEEGPDLEIAHFYDFSVLNGEDKDMEKGEENDVNNQALAVTSEGTELILPSGAHIGHRDYKKYYNQNLRDNNDSNSKALMNITEKYKLLGYYEIGSSGMTIEKERLENMKAARNELKKYDKERSIVGQKANKLHVAMGRLGHFKNLFLE